MYKFDIYKNDVIEDSTLNPTEITQEVFPKLYARNNKYPDHSVDPMKVGKWMLFVSPHQSNEIWKKIIKAVQEGELWSSKISKPNSSRLSHAIMIYTKDYEDIEDVIKVLNYLETSGIKSPHTIIKYKTDEQTYAGIYRGGNQKPWIYSSDVIRNKYSPANVSQCRVSGSLRSASGATNVSPSSTTSAEFQGNKATFSRK